MHPRGTILHPIGIMMHPRGTMTHPRGTMMHWRGTTMHPSGGATWSSFSATIAEEEQQCHIGADCSLIVPEEEEVRIENERRVHVRLVANQKLLHWPCTIFLVKASVLCHYQLLYSARSSYHWGEHHTPCWECLLNDPDECFWILTCVGMDVLGQQVRTGRQLLNNQVQFLWIRVS